MIFNSLAFFVFLAITLLVYYRLPFKPQNLFLLAASYFFYGWWDWRFLFLLVFTSLFDFYCALLIEKQFDTKKRRWLLAFSLTLNMGVLCTFKYFNFFADGLTSILNSLGMQASLPVIHVLLPLGISFYTFLSMSYTIDVYRGELKAERDLVCFLLFVSFFPHLVAGPIVRASYLIPQCAAPRVIQPKEVVNGIWLILLGYVQKVVIADRLGGIVDLGFNNRGMPIFNDANAWLILYAFAFQIYGDFAGYSNIARGLSKIMGFELPINFRAPYLVTNPAAFWHHWHITLSTWLRDYLYIPLGGNRKGPIRTYINLMVTMVLGGLWHGAGIAFVLWGAFQGLLLVLHRAWCQIRKKSAQMNAEPSSSGWGFFPSKAILVIVFFHITCLGWLLFRAGSLADHDQFASIGAYLRSLSHFNLCSGVSAYAQPVFLLGALGLFLQWKCDAMERFDSWPTALKATAIVGALTAIAALGVFQGSQFIYFQF